MAAGQIFSSLCLLPLHARIANIPDVQLHHAGLIARDLDLFRARYKETAAYGHFGRDNLKTFTWEKVKPLS